MLDDGLTIALNRGTWRIFPTILAVESNSALLNGFEYIKV